MCKNSFVTRIPTCLPQPFLDYSVNRLVHLARTSVFRFFTVYDIALIIPFTLIGNDSQSSHMEYNNLNRVPVFESRFRSRNLPFNIFLEKLHFQHSEVREARLTQQNYLSNCGGAKKWQPQKTSVTLSVTFSNVLLCAREDAGKRGEACAFGIFFTFTVVRFNYFSIKLLAAAAPFTYSAHHIDFC